LSQGGGIKAPALHCAVVTAFAVLLIERLAEVFHQRLSATFMALAEGHHLLKLVITDFFDLKSLLSLPSLFDKPCSGLLFHAR